MSLPVAHPAFARHFTDPLYESTTDDVAPFGSDEGSDMLWDWGRRREELAATPSLAKALGAHTSDPDAATQMLGPIEDRDQSVIVRSAGFTLLRLVGHLSDADRDVVLRCLDFEIAMYADTSWLPADVSEGAVAQLRRQHSDLVTWVDPGREVIG